MISNSMVCRGLVRFALVLVLASLAVACAAPGTAPTAEPPVAATAAPTAAAPTVSSSASSSAPAPTTAPNPTAAGPAAPAPQYGGVLRVTDAADGVSIGFPSSIPNINGLRQASPAVETLLRYDSSGNLVPWLASAFTTDVPSKSITLTIRNGVKFHDGTDFNAQAVKWNLDLSISKKMAGTEKFKSVEATDDSTVRITLTEWDSTVTGSLAQYLGMMISPTAVQKNGEQWATSNPIGTGPFQFVSWQKDVKTVYKKFDGYWQKGKPYLDGIEWIPIPDGTIRVASFKAGEVDLMVTTVVKDVALLEKAGYLITRGRVGSGTTGLVPDSANSKSPFADVRVRQAVAYAIDTKTIVASLYGAEAEPANQYAYKGHWGYNPAVVGYPYDPTKAKQLLAEAGYPKGFTTNLTYLASSPEAEQINTAIQGYLKEVGIEVKLEAAPSSRFSPIQQGGKWEGLITATTTANPDVAAALAQRYAGNPKYNGLMLAPEDYVQLLQNAIVAVDFQTKQKNILDAQKLLIDKYSLIIPIFTQFSTAVTQQTVHSHGFYSTPFNGQWTPEDVWLTKK